MTFDYPPTPKSRGTYKDRTPGKKAMMVRRAAVDFYHRHHHLSAQIKGGTGRVPDTAPRLQDLSTTR